MLASLILLWAVQAADPGVAEAVAPSEAALARAAEYSQSQRGDALVVMFDGRVVFEKYADPAAAETRHLLASGSKSFVGVAAAAAVDDALIKFDDPVADAILVWKDDPLKSKITYRQLLSLTSGLTPSERGAALRAPSWKDILDKPMTGRPGEQFAYGAYQLNAAAAAIEARLKNEETFEKYLQRRVFEPLGMTVEWRFRCDDEKPQVGGGAFANARDWAKFGEFLRLEGRVGDKPIVKAETLAECFQGSKSNPAYGLTFWLKEPVTEAQSRGNAVLNREWAPVANSQTIPEDLFAAAGAGKQRLYVIPSRKLVVVRLGGFPTRFEDAEFLDRLLAPPEAAR